MKVRVAPRLSYGNGDACVHHNDGSLAVVHACKDPCHRHAVGYTTRTIPNTHPNYLVLERGHHLYLNVIDPDRPMFMMPTFVHFLKFVDREIAEREVLIHCNQGESRAPSLALLYMAKRLKLLPNDSYQSAAAAFREKFTYKPGIGIQTWLTQRWNEVV